MPDGRVKIRAELWSLTKKGVYSALERFPEDNWAFIQVYRNYPLYFIEPSRSVVPVTPAGEVWAPGLDDVETGQ